MADKIDDKTLQLMEQVKKQKEEISKAEKPNFSTNCAFSYTGKANDTINLHAERYVENLIDMAGFLHDKEKRYKDAEILLDVKGPPFKWLGYSVEEWLGDIKLRINKIQITSKKKKLEALESRLNAIISPELKRAMELEAIAKEL